MYYPSYDDYMRDIFYYNGTNMGYQANPNMYMGPPGYMSNYGYMPNMSNNFNNLYPSIYRIVYPVVQKVTTENNFPVMNDEAVTNVTDRIYNIVEGDISTAQTSAQGNNSNASVQRNSNVATNSNTTQNTQDSYSNSATQTSSRK